MLAEQRRRGAVADPLAVGRERRRHELAPGELLEDAGRAQLLLCRRPRSRSFTGEAGTPASRSRASRPAVVSVAILACSSGISSSRLAIRSGFVAKRSSTASSGAPTARQAFSKRRSLRGHDHQLAVGGLEHLVRDDQREGGAVASGRRAAASTSTSGRHERERRLVEREVERAALLPRAARRRSRARPRRRCHVDQGDADPTPGRPGSPVTLMIPAAACISGS